MMATLIRPLRVVWAFLVRDFFVETSYRLSFLFTIGSVVVRALVFFFLSEFIESAAGGLLGDYGGDYFSFVIIGIALGGYFSTGLSSFANALRQSQMTGTLEAMILTPTPVSWLIIGSAAWSYVYTTFRVLVYLVVGALFLGLDLSRANYLAAFVILVLSVISFASLGILAASLIMVIKRGNPITAVFGNVSNLVGGVFYPVAILPGWLQIAAYMLPITYALQATRAALLHGATWDELAADILALTLFCLILLPLALILFRFAVNRARVEGTLAHY
ncbi:MAG: ABC transporter [Chloroflexi bacterium]|nr:MAG: ABC transporter [Chloroflexota bacterium]PIE80234.1 MAG: ABC transporter [Chloroflexota bacterium]